MLVGLIALCLSLGNWQLNRASEKRALVNAGAVNYSLPQILSEPDRAIWGQTSLTGKYIAETPVLLGNQTHLGQQGFQAFSRFTISSGETLLINRGWLPEHQAAQPPPGDLTTISGIVAPYRRAGMRLGPPVVSLPAETPIVVNYPTQQEWEQLYQQPLLPITLWLGADEPYGYVRDWTIQSIPPEKHLGYAFQWFAMATAVAVIGIILLLRLRRKHD